MSAYPLYVPLPRTLCGVLAAAVFLLPCSSHAEEGLSAEMLPPPSFDTGHARAAHAAVDPPMS